MWAASAVVVLLAVTAFLLDLGGAVVARHRAQAAADLAALAAAGDPVEGEPAACAAAARVTSAMSAELARCSLDGWHALVEVRIARPWALLTRDAAVARAHAGPVLAEQALAGPVLVEQALAGPALAEAGSLTPAVRSEPILAGAAPAKPILMAVPARPVLAEPVPGEPDLAGRHPIEPVPTEPVFHKHPLQIAAPRGRRSSVITTDATRTTRSRGLGGRRAGMSGVGNPRAPRLRRDRDGRPVDPLGRHARRPAGTDRRPRPAAPARTGPTGSRTEPLALDATPATYTDLRPESASSGWQGTVR